ncbi:hypothetical protein [Streptomyces sp. NPDC005953]|uniref:hypothetical protein n=1 Tax=Streptomyces sp. NPDC005953 TaxID=3156719 RepID=UPI0033E3E322
MTIVLLDACHPSCAGRRPTPHAHPASGQTMHCIRCFLQRLSAFALIVFVIDQLPKP